MAENNFFPNDEQAIAYLKDRDKQLAAVIDRVGRIEREVEPDLFAALVRNIAGQQISTKAATTVCNRLHQRLGAFTPASVLALSEEQLQQCGISFRKASYIRELALAIDEGRLNLPQLAELSDAEVCSRLSAQKGIGVWTAEMLMIFSMCRPNVLSYGDLAIQRGLRMLYRHRQITPQLFAKYQRRYAPYASTASLYLWAVAGGALPELSDPAAKSKAAKSKAAAKGASKA